jgi:general stress protein 26
MTPRKKANDLVLEMHRIENDPEHYMSIDNAKKCALVAVENIIGMVDEESLYSQYWDEVREEILKM